MADVPTTMDDAVTVMNSDPTDDLPALMIVMGGHHAPKMSSPGIVPSLAAPNSADRNLAGKVDKDVARKVVDKMVANEGRVAVAFGAKKVAVLVDRIEEARGASEEASAQKIVRKTDVSPAHCYGVANIHPSRSGTDIPASYARAAIRTRAELDTTTVFGVLL